MVIFWLLATFFVHTGDFYDLIMFCRITSKKTHSIQKLGRRWILRFSWLSLGFILKRWAVLHPLKCFQTILVFHVRFYCIFWTMKIVTICVCLQTSFISRNLWNFCLFFFLLLTSKNVNFLEKMWMFLVFLNSIIIFSSHLQCLCLIVPQPQ